MVSQPQWTGRYWDRVRMGYGLKLLNIINDPGMARDVAGLYWIMRQCAYLDEADRILSAYAHPLSDAYSGE